MSQATVERGSTLITGVECIAPCYHEDWAWTFQVNGKLPLRDALEDAVMAYLDARESGLPTPPITLAKLVAGARIDRRLPPISC
jgi:hypothetical protein